MASVVRAGFGLPESPHRTFGSALQASRLSLWERPAVGRVRVSSWRNESTLTPALSQREREERDNPEASLNS